MHGGTPTRLLPCVACSIAPPDSGIPTGHTATRVQDSDGATGKGVCGVTAVLDLSNFAIVLIVLLAILVFVVFVILLVAGTQASSSPSAPKTSSKSADPPSKEDGGRREQGAKAEEARTASIYRHARFAIAGVVLAAGLIGVPIVVAHQGLECSTTSETLDGAEFEVSAKRTTSATTDATVETRPTTDVTVASGSTTEVAGTAMASPDKMTEECQQPSVSLTSPIVLGAVAVAVVVLLPTMSEVGVPGLLSLKLKVEAQQKEVEVTKKETEVLHRQVTAQLLEVNTRAEASTTNTFYLGARIGADTSQQRGGQALIGLTQSLKDAGRLTAGDGNFAAAVLLHTSPGKLSSPRPSDGRDHSLDELVIDIYEDAHTAAQAWNRASDRISEPFTVSTRDRGVAQVREIAVPLIGSDEGLRGVLFASNIHYVSELTAEQADAIFETLTSLVRACAAQFAAVLTGTMNVPPAPVARR